MYVRAQKCSVTNKSGNERIAQFDFIVDESNSISYRGWIYKIKDTTQTIGYRFWASWALGNTQETNQHITSTLAKQGVDGDILSKIQQALRTYQPGIPQINILDGYNLGRNISPVLFYGVPRLVVKGLYGEEWPAYRRNNNVSQYRNCSNCSFACRDKENSFRNQPYERSVQDIKDQPHLPLWRCAVTGAFVDKEITNNINATWNSDQSHGYSRVQKDRGYVRTQGEPQTMSRPRGEDESRYLSIVKLRQMSLEENTCPAHMFKAREQYQDEASRLKDINPKTIRWFKDNTHVCEIMGHKIRLIELDVLGEELGKADLAYMRKQYV